MSDPTKTSLIGAQGTLADRLAIVAKEMQEGHALTTKLRTGHLNGRFIAILKNLLASMGIQLERTTFLHVAQKLELFINQNQAAFAGLENVKNRENCQIILDKIVAGRLENKKLKKCYDTCVKIIRIKNDKPAPTQSEKEKPAPTPSEKERELKAKQAEEELLTKEKAKKEAEAARLKNAEEAGVQICSIYLNMYKLRLSCKNEKIPKDHPNREEIKVKLPDLAARFFAHVDFKTLNNIYDFKHLLSLAIYAEAPETIKSIIENTCLLPAVACKQMIKMGLDDAILEDKPDFFKQFEAVFKKSCTTWCEEQKIVSGSAYQMWTSALNLEAFEIVDYLVEQKIWHPAVLHSLSVSKKVSREKFKEYATKIIRQDPSVLSEIDGLVLLSRLYDADKELCKWMLNTFTGHRFSAKNCSVLEDAILDNDMEMAELIIEKDTKMSWLEMDGILPTDDKEQIIEKIKANLGL
jgi:hypothetical protein